MDLKSSPFLMALVVMLHDHATHSQDGLKVSPSVETQTPAGLKRSDSVDSWKHSDDNLGDNMDDNLGDNLGDNMDDNLGDHMDDNFNDHMDENH